MQHESPEIGRFKQRRRTRNAVLTAAKTLIQQGTTPSVADAADAADVSRRTAYRYFPTQEQLLTEAMLDESRSSIEGALAADDDVEARLDALIRAIYANLREQEALHRTMLRLTVDRSPDEAMEQRAEVLPRRGYRRIEWIELALQPMRHQVNTACFHRLVSGIALCVGIEPLLVLRDIRGLDLDTAEAVACWTAKVLLRATLTDECAP